MAALINAYPDEIVWTSGGTEADNWALWGVALANLQERGHILVSAIEHHAVLEPAHTLRELGFGVEEVRPDTNGVVSAASVGMRLRPETRLVSVMLVNNETGVIQPVAEIGQTLRANGSVALLHTDATQAAGKMPLDARALGCDVLTLSAHKMGGPKGVGALYIKRGTPMKAFLRGGAQERGRRAGTENVPGIVGFGLAAEAARAELASESARLTALRDELELGLATHGALINGAPVARAPHITNTTLPGRRAETLALNLDLRGFAVGTGSACASGAIEPSHVLTAMGRDGETARASLRISLGRTNMAEDVRALLSVLEELLNRRDAETPRKGRDGEEGL